MISNYHTHSKYCDGKGELRDYVEYALAHGLTHLGFSGHCPLPLENDFGIRPHQYLDYCNEVRSLKEEYKGRIDIRLGLEIDYIPGVLEDFSDLIHTGNLEYTIGSVHLVANPTLHPSPSTLDELWMIDGGRYETYDEGLQRIFHGDIRLGVKHFFRQTNEMLQRNRPTIVGHFDKIVMHNRGRYFQYDEPWFQSLLGETVLLIRDLGLIAEVNTRGLYKGRHDDYYPARRTLLEMSRLGIPVIVSTDAHRPEDLTLTEGAPAYLHSLPYRPLLTHLP